MLHPFYKISHTVLYVLLGIILISVALFYGVGYDNERPLYTDVLIVLVYGMLFLALLVTMVAVFFQFVHAWKLNRKRAHRLLWGVVLFAALFGVTYLLSSDEPVMAQGKVYDNVFWLRTVDMLLYAVYLLLGIALLCIIGAITKVFKRIRIKR